MNEKKIATIVSGSFLSLQNLAETISPDATITLLHNYLSIARNSMQKTGGAFTDMFDGTIAAFWGVHTTSGSPAHDALNAVRSALILRAAFQKTNSTADKRKRILQSVCGINTGTVITDDPKLGAKNRRYLIGQNTLLAIRAREIAEKNNVDIVITAKTWRLIEQYVIVEEIEPLPCANGKATRLFALVNLRAKQEAEQAHPTTLRELKSLLSLGAI
ncbi:MAG: hypothetical protein LBT01_07640 [Spirochaetaceae bacterium]|nr:hypothetical protein [Spirochaetaceae bacterium]